MKIGFVLLSPSAKPIPSTRVAVLNMWPYLQKAGLDPYIVFDPICGTQVPTLDLSADRLLADGYKVICFQKISSPSVLVLVQALRQRGIKTVYMVCDLVDIEMARSTDATVVVTDFLKSLYPRELHSKIHVVHDGIEKPDIFKASWRCDSGSRARPLRAVLVTSSTLNRLPVLRSLPPWLEVLIVGRYGPYTGLSHRLRDILWNLRSQANLRDQADMVRFLTSSRISLVPWHPVRVYDQMLTADIGIIPIERSTSGASESSVPFWKVKSENRLTMKMSVGLPVIATPIPAYEAVVTQGSNGVFANSREDWARAFDLLRDPIQRRRVGEEARASVLERYSKDNQAFRLINVLKKVVFDRDA